MRCAELFYRSVKVRGDSGDACFVALTRSVISRLARDEPHFMRAWNSEPLGPGAKCAVEVARHNGDIPSGNECADARLELMDSSIG